MLSRRQFLRATGSATIATSVVYRSKLGVGAMEFQRAPLNIYKSLKWGMIQVEGSTLEKFQLLKRLGYDGVEIDSPVGVDPDEALAASQEAGLPIEGVVNSTHWKIRHSDPDANVRSQALANMQTAMRTARRVGADSVLLVPGKVTDPDLENHDHVWNRSIADIRRLLPLAEKLNVKILIENVGNDFCTDPKTFAQYIDEIDHPMVGVHFDIGNHITYSPPADWIRTLSYRIRKLDVKDRLNEGRVKKLIGEGDADWPEVRTALVDIGYQGWAAAEVTGGDEVRLADVLARMNRELGRSDGKPGKDLPGATVRPTMRR